MPERVLRWPGCANVRDLGGLPTGSGATTRFGRVVRAADLARVSDAGWRAIEASGVSRVVDLRFPDERLHDGPRPAGIEVIAVSVLGERDPAYWEMLHADRDAMGETGYMRFSYGDFLARHANGFAEALRAVAAADGAGAVVVHCVGGKDRTGLVVALMLRLAGVPVTAVDADYALSETQLGAAGLVPTDFFGRPRPPRSPAGVMRHVIESLEARHGSTEAYLHEAGCTPAAVERIRQRLLD